MKRTTAIAAALVGLVVFVPTAAAGETSDATTAVASSDTSTSTTTTVPPTTATAEVPVTTSTTTSTPTTSTPVTTTSTPTTSTPVTTTSVPTTTTTTSIPTTDAEAPCVADCIPVAEACTGAACVPTAGGASPSIVGAGSLPFTGIEDVIAPLLLALTVVLGGVVAWRWARLRESVAEAAQRARTLPARETRTGYELAARSFRIEQRARQVFTPRVA